MLVFQSKLEISNVHAKWNIQLLLEKQTQG